MLWALVFATLVSARADPRSTGQASARHPVLDAFGISSEIPSGPLYLVRTPHPLPRLDGTKVHGRAKRDCYLVSGPRETIARFRELPAHVIPIDLDAPYPPRLSRTWKRVTVPDPVIQAAVDQVSWDGLRPKIQMLQDFGTRLSCAPNRDTVRDSLAAFFDDLGLDVTLQRFGRPAFWYCTEFTYGHNVIAQQTGVLYPDSIVIICAHYDSWSEDPMVSAPGADDNASGVAAVMTAAELLTRHRFAYTIQYICFGGEEYGPYGSGYYVRRAYSDGLNIVGVLNFDMIGFWPEGVDFVLEVEPIESSVWLAEALVNAAELYTDTPCDTHIPDIGWSDNASFWAYGYAALNNEEAWDFADPDFNPHWHNSSDRIYYLHPGFTVACTRVAVAALATVAQPWETVPTLVRSFDAWRTGSGVELAWDVADDGGVRGFNIYRGIQGEVPTHVVNASSLIPPQDRAYRDAGARRGLSYWYVLGVVTEGGSETRSTPIEVAGDDVILELGRTYPNPFNSSTTIPYTIEEPGHVDLRIYDVIGRLVQTLVEGDKSPGPHTASWDGRNADGLLVASGVYVVRLESGGRILKRKIALLR